MMRSCVCSSSADLVTDSPGRVVGMYSSVPSLRFGMNSVPTCSAGQTDTPRTTSASAMVSVLALQHAADDRPIDGDQRRG